MGHEKYLELNTLSVYGELNSEEQSELLQHLLLCNECRTDFEEKMHLKDLVTENRNDHIVSDQLITQARRELRIGERKGSFSGMLKTRTFRIIFISKEKMVTFSPEIIPDVTVSYDGNSKSIFYKEGRN